MKFENSCLAILRTLARETGTPLSTLLSAHPSIGLPWLLKQAALPMADVVAAFKRYTLRMRHLSWNLTINYGDNE